MKICELGTVSVRTTAAVFLTAAPLIGQQFDSPVLITAPSGGIWYSLSSADVDRDGQDDLAYIARPSAPNSPSSLYLIRGTPNGFRPPELIHTFTSSIALYCVLADFDNDGDLDLVAGGNDVWLFTNHSGNFSAPILTNTPSHVRGYAADIDSDGQVDLLLEGDNCYSCFVSLRACENTGGALVYRSANLGSGFSGVALGDIDGDGDPDALFPRTPIRWLENPGVFGSPWTARDFGAGPDYRNVALADVDGDGDLDALATRGSELDVLENQLSGNFAIASTIVDAGGAGNLGQLLVEDFDADGINDICVTSSIGDGELQFLRGRGGLAFSAMTTAAALGQNANTYTLLSSDVDDDGYLDVVTSRNLADSARIRFLINRQSGIGVTYDCPSVPNSTGEIAEIRAEGSSSVFLNTLSLTALKLPPLQFGMFFVGPGSGVTGAVPNSQGALCISGSVGRFNGPGEIQQADTGGELDLVVNLNAVPGSSSTIAVAPGDTWRFQAWYRDSNPGGTSNFTSAVAVTFY